MTPQPQRRISWPNIFTLLALALVGVGYFSVFADLDWSWQVRTGEVIVQTGTLRVEDSFSYTIHGERLHDFEWLYEVLLYLVWNAFGSGGLKLLKVIVIFTPLLLVAWRLCVGGVKWHGVVLALGLAVFVLTPAWNLRPLYVTTIGLLLLAGLLRDHCTGRKPLPWWTVLVTLLWANMHPGVITGQGLLLGAIGWEWLNRRLMWNPPLDRPSITRLTLIGGLAFLATFVCPDPIERLRYTFMPELAHPIMRIFAEMHPLYTFITTPPSAVGLVYVLAALVLCSVFARFTDYRAWEIALLAGTALLGNIAYRSMMDWLLVMLAVAGPRLKDMLASAARRDRRRPTTATLLRADRCLRRCLTCPLFVFQPGWLALGCAAFIVLSLVPAWSRAMPIENSPDWPVAALDAAQRAGLKGRFFGPPDYGAYVGWRLKDNGLCYTDTRGFFFPPLLLEDSHFIPQLGPQWRERIDRVIGCYHTDFFLLETEGPRGQLWQTLQPHIDTPLYRDQKCVLLSTAQVRQGLERMDRALAGLR